MCRGSPKPCSVQVTGLYQAIVLQGSDQGLCEALELQGLVRVVWSYRGQGTGLRVVLTWLLQLAQKTWSLQVLSREVLQQTGLTVCSRNLFFACAKALCNALSVCCPILSSHMPAENPLEVTGLGELGHALLALKSWSPWQYATERVGQLAKPKKRIKSLEISHFFSKTPTLTTSHM